MADLERSRPPRRSPWRSPNIAAAVVLVTIAAAIVLWQQPWRADGPVASPRSDAARTLPAQLDDLSRATTRSAFERAAGGSDAARSWARRVWSARQTLGIEEIRFSYASGGDAPDRADGSATARVDVAWEPARDSVLGTRPTRPSVVALRVAPGAGDRSEVVGASGTEGSSLPLWLAGVVRVREAGAQAAVIQVGDDAEGPSLDAQVRRAGEVVRSTVLSSKGRLVVVSPASRATTAQLLGRSQDQVDAVAAVTTTLDGSRTSSRVVVLNPRLFATMDDRAAQVVMTHEATHLLTGVVGTDLPAWILEGFADYVALLRDDAPLSVSAGQALRRVEDGELPDRLPEQSDFGNETHGLGAVYESAWLAFRLLGERYGESRVVAFYDATVAGTPVAQALQASFGLTQQQLTQDWRDYLTNMASTVS